MKEGEVGGKGGATSKAWWLGGLFLLVIVGIVLYVLRGPGEEIAELALPGELGLELGTGDQLAFHVDTAVLFQRKDPAKSTPSGCELKVALLQEGRAVHEASCDLYGTDRFIAVARSGSSKLDRDSGLYRVSATRQRLTCQLRAPAAGRMTLRATTNLDTCVPKVLAPAAAHVFLDRAD